MFRQLFTCLRLFFWPALISLFLIQCKKADDTPVTPTAPSVVVTPPLSTTTAPQLTEVAKAQTGLTLLPTADYEKIPVYVAKSYKGGRRATSAVVDLTPNMPPIGNQGQQGSCVGWASAYAIRSYLYHADTQKAYLQSNGSLDGTTVFSPAFVYNSINNGSDEGSSPRDAYSLMIQQGVCSLSDMPYQENYPGYKVQPTDSQKQKAANFRITGFGRTLVNTDNLKACLSQGTIIQLSIKCDRNFIYPTSQIAGEYVWKIFDEGSYAGLHANHAIVLVGYDDSKNAFKLMNSWGTNWANKGFIWMDYGIISQVVKEAYIPYTISSFAQLAVYDPSTNYSGAGTWVEKAAYPGMYPGGVDVSFTINNIIYVSGSGTSDNDNAWLGKASLYAYNPVTNIWVKKSANLPATGNDYKAYSGIESFVIGSKGYLVTGFANSSGNVARRVWEYDPMADTWSAKKNLPFDNNAQRSNPVAVSYNGKGYFGLNANVGGADYGKELWEYDPATDSWKLKTTLPDEANVGLVTAYGVIGDKLYIVLSQINKIVEKGNTLLYEYDLTKNTWTKKRSLGNFSIGHSGVGAVLNGQLYCGLTYTDAGNGKTSNNNLFAYNPQTDNWVQVKDLPVTQRSSKIGILANNKLYVGFGSNFVNGQGYTYFSDWWEYTP